MTNPLYSFVDKIKNGAQITFYRRGIGLFAANTSTNGKIWGIERVTNGELRYTQPSLVQPPTSRGIPGPNSTHRSLSKRAIRNATSSPRSMH
jgi:hypothetical protein